MKPRSHGPIARLSADIGGTFTDVVLECGLERWSRKVLTTHRAPEDGLLRGIRETLCASGITAQEIGAFVHGTTLAINAILERRGARAALLTTEGFRDVLEIGYQGRFDPMDLWLVKQRPLIPREWRHVVTERMSASGDVLLPLDERRLPGIVERLSHDSIDSLAIGFLHAYVNPAHEQRARDIIRQLDPELSISLSSEVCPEIREYERISTVCANAYIQPLITRYLDRLATSLVDLGLRCPAFLMTSGGGVMPLQLAKHVPIRLVESGPAGGAILAASIATELGEPRILSFDMGGTTAKICIITDASPQVARLFEVDRAARFKKGSGLPLRIPVVELVEIGAGGGSIASVDAMGRITVGPQSSGSEPGPASYARGGDRPTVTDANVLLGKIDPDRFAGGTIPLDPDRARDAMVAHVGAKLDMDAIEAAFGAIEMVDETMANAARAHAAELGKELAEHTLVAFGGAAPLHAARLAEKLGITRVIIPRGAGVGSALGLLRAPLAYDVVVSRLVRLNAYDPAAVREILDTIMSKAAAVVETLGGAQGLTTTRTADMRYVGQGHEIKVPLGAEAPTAAELRCAFEARYAALFGRVIPHATIEVISWQIRFSRDTWSAADSGREKTVEKPVGEPAAERRMVFDSHEAAFTKYAAYERTALSPGCGVTGPALIIEDETTTVVPAPFRARVDTFGHLVLERVAPEAAQA